MSPDSHQVLTGAYHGHTHVIDLTKRVNTTIGVNFKDKRGKSCGYTRPYKRGNKRLVGTVAPSELPSYLPGGLLEVDNEMQVSSTR